MPEVRERGPFARTVGVAAITLVLLLAAWTIADVLLLLFGCVLFSLALSGAAEWIAERSRLTRGWALALVFTGLLALAAILIWALSGRIADQVSTLSEALPKAAAGFSEKLRGYEWGRRLLDSISNWQESGVRGDVFGRATGVFSTGLGLIVNFVILFFGTLYLAVNPAIYRQGMIALVPPAHRDRVDGALCETASILRSWLLGKLLVMAYVGVLTTVGLALLGVPLAFALGLIAAVLDFVPNFGPIIAFIPAGLIALAIDPMLALWVALLYLGAQQTESYIVTPLVQRKASHLMPAAIIFGQIALGVMFGVLGLLFAEPLVAAGQVLVRRLYIDVMEEKAAG
jgi:predicted PurR-regulated permease PerM